MIKRNQKTSDPILRWRDEGRNNKAAALVIERERELASDELLQSCTSSRNKATPEKGIKKRTAPRLQPSGKPLGHELQESPEIHSVK